MNANARNLIKNQLAHEFVRQAEDRGLFDGLGGRERRVKLEVETLLASFFDKPSTQRAVAELAASRPALSGTRFAR